MFNSRILRLAAGAAGALALVGTLGHKPAVFVGGDPALRAQGSITISFDLGGGPTDAVWPVGPDYATDVLGDPWDFGNSEDISIDPNETVNWSNFAVSGGLAGGTTASGDAYLTTLYRGYYDTLISSWRNGRRLPIDSSKYRKLSLRMSDSTSGSQPQVYWYHYPGGADPGDPSGNGAFGCKILSQTVAGNQIYVQDLSQTQSCGTAWTDGVVRGFRIDPNDASHAGNNVFFDWVRLTTGDSASDAASVDIAWSGGSGNATVEVLDANSTVVRVATSTSSNPYTWNYGVLPPGTYTMRVTRGGLTGTKAFTVNNPPLVEVTDPDETGGENYATKVLGNAWDMDSAADIRSSANVTTPTFSTGALTATNTGTTGDPNITLLDSDVPTPIDTSRYHLLTYRFEIDGAFDVGLGSVARVLWGSQQFFGADKATTTKDIIAWPGMNSYTMDLSTLSAGTDNGLESSGAAEAWTNGSKTFFRFDPHEFAAARTFHVDDIKLAATDETVNNAFTIKWSGSDADGGNPSVTLYYDTDTDTASKTLIAGGLVMSQTSYDWDTSSVPTGTYYIYVEASDGVQTHGRYSRGPVRVVRPTAEADPRMSVDAPSSGSTIIQPFTVSGWTVDLGASSGTGVDQVQISAQLASGGDTTVLGNATLFGRRDDIGAVYGSQFINSGYTFSVNGLAPGSYNLIVAAHSTVTGTFNQSRTVAITLPTSDPWMSLDTPSMNATVGPTFTMAGWAIDRADPTGTGVDEVNVWSYPLNSDGTVGSPAFLGQATYGSARDDIGAFFGSRFTNSGYSITVSSLAAGRYRVVVYAHSKVETAKNDQKSVDLTVTGPVSDPRMSIDGPQANAVVYQPFLTGGWAVDLGATTGTGVDAVHVWAFPVVNGVIDAANGVFVAQGQGGGLRSDVGDVFGSQFDYSGFTFIVQGLSPGVYELGVYARSTVAGTFNQVKFVRITIKDTDPYMSIDGPSPNSIVEQPFLTGGWAVDLASKTDSGVDAVHVWAFPVINGVIDAANGIFVAQGQGGGLRADVGAVFGSQFDYCGFTFIVQGLTPGEYELGVYARSSVVGAFNDVKFVRITVQ